MELKDFINKINNVLIVYHIDADGLCSASLMKRYLESKGKKTFFLPSSPKEISETKFYDIVITQNCDGLVIVDIPADQNPKLMQLLSNKIPILIIDHHQLTKNLNSEKNIIHYNSCLEYDKYIPCSMYIKKKLVLNDDLAWLAYSGTIGDYGGEVWKEEITKKLEEEGYEIGDDPRLFDSIYGEIAKLISAARNYKGVSGIKKALKILNESNNPQEFINKAGEIKEWELIIDNYIEELINQYEKNKERIKDLELNIFTIKKPKYAVGSALTTILSSRKENEAIILITVNNNKANVNARRQDGKLDLGKVMRKATQDFDKAGGGGHKQAAGGFLLEKDLSEFKQKLKDVIRNELRSGE